jgi:hypothetical protein
MARECLSGAYGLVTDAQNLIAILPSCARPYTPLKRSRRSGDVVSPVFFDMALLKSPMNGKLGHNWGHREIR